MHPDIDGSGDGIGGDNACGSSKRQGEQDEGKPPMRLKSGLDLNKICSNQCGMGKVSALNIGPLKVGTRQVLSLKGMTG